MILIQLNYRKQGERRGERSEEEPSLLDSPRLCTSTDLGHHWVTSRFFYQYFQVLQLIKCSPYYILFMGTPLALSALFINCDQSSKPQCRCGVQARVYLSLRPILRLVVVAPEVTALSGRCNPPPQNWCFVELRQPSPDYFFSPPSRVGKVLLFQSK